ncbi:hypothetical protein ACET3Z_024774 [Daucus carota]
MNHTQNLKIEDKRNSKKSEYSKLEFKTQRRSNKDKKTSLEGSRALVSNLYFVTSDVRVQHEQKKEDGSFYIPNDHTKEVFQNIVLMASLLKKVVDILSKHLDLSDQC